MSPFNYFAAAADCTQTSRAEQFLKIIKAKCSYAIFNLVFLKKKLLLFNENVYEALGNFKI